MWSALLLVAACVAFGDNRVGGAYEIAYESLNAGGVSFASAGPLKLGGTVGQAGLIRPGTNGAVQAESGFWKADGLCAAYPPVLAELSRSTHSFRLVFSTVPGGIYTVAAVSQEAGGPGAGLAAWTNVAAGPVVGQGVIGSSTTLYDTVVSATNLARFYLIRCEDP